MAVCILIVNPKYPYIMVFAENLGWVGFLLVCFHHVKAIPTHEKIFAVCEKVAEMPHLTYFLLGWIGVGLGSSTVS